MKQCFQRRFLSNNSLWVPILTRIITRLTSSCFQTSNQSPEIWHSQQPLYIPLRGCFRNFRGNWPPPARISTTFASCLSLQPRFLHSLEECLNWPVNCSEYFLLGIDCWLPSFWFLQDACKSSFEVFSFCFILLFVFVEAHASQTSYRYLMQESRATMLGNFLVL